jgi:hypothetical protein
MSWSKKAISSAWALLWTFVITAAPIERVAAQQAGTETISRIFPLSDGEVAGYDGSVQALRIFKLKGSELQQLRTIPVSGLVSAMVVMEQGYAFATSLGGGDRNAPIKVYTVSRDGSNQKLVYQHSGERNQVTGLIWQNARLWIDLFQSKYFTSVGYLSPSTTASEWGFTEVAGLRMGDSFDVMGDVIVVGRSYGDEQGDDGDLLLFTDGARKLLPSYRGVRGVKLFGDRTVPSMVIGDGWHADYGRVAQGRVSLLRRRSGERQYSLEIIDRDTSNHSFDKFYVRQSAAKTVVFALGNHSLNQYRDTGAEWEKKVVYAQQDPARLMDMALVKDEGTRVVFAVLDGGIRMVTVDG